MKKTVMMVFAAMLAAAAMAAERTVVYSTGFDTPDGVKGWTQSAVWKVEKGAGVGGTAALVWTNSNPLGYEICSFPIPGAKEGRSYRASFKVKADSLSGGRVNGTICWVDGGKWIGGAGGTVERWGDAKLKPCADGWYEMNVRTTPFLPSEATGALLQLFIHRGGVGRVAFDDVRIELVGEKKIGDVRAFTTSRYRDVAADGDVRFIATVEIPRDCWGKGKTIAEMAYRASDGSMKTVRMDLPDVAHAETTLPVSALAMGRHQVTVSARGADGRGFGGKTLVFERVAELPKRRVWCDRFNRMFVDGRPFFPLGMFWSIGTLEKDANSIERYATGPFNCLQNYDHTLTAKDLDRFWAKGLRVLVGIKDVFAPIPPNVVLEGHNMRFARPKGGDAAGLKTWADEDRYLTNLAESLKSHPALLGWYGCDEFPETFHDRLKERYELMKRVDPDHPVFITVTGRNGARAFIDCTDAVGIDAYDIHNAHTAPVSKPDFGEAWIGADRTQSIIDGTHGALCIWQVPQAFANNWDHKGRRPDLGFPTFKELKSQAWQEIAVGANGLFFYSYSQIRNCPEGEEAKDEYFRRTCTVAEEIRRMIPVLTLEPGPKVVSTPKRVRVRTWRDGAAVYVLVCNTHPEPRTGTVLVEGGFSSCRAEFGGGVALKNGTLSLDMEPFGVTIVRLAAP
jgi:hypothetical protein